jgi:hypothetical protein
MTNVESQMTNECPKTEMLNCLGHSEFIRHLAFVIRHSLPRSVSPIPWLRDRLIRARCWVRGARIPRSCQCNRHDSRSNRPRLSIAGFAMSDGRHSLK